MTQDWFGVNEESTNGMGPSGLNLAHSVRLRHELDHFRVHVPCGVAIPAMVLASATLPMW